LKPAQTVPLRGPEVAFAFEVLRDGLVGDDRLKVCDLGFGVLQLPSDL
jgi:hypothetical protein